MQTDQLTAEELATERAAIAAKCESWTQPPSPRSSDDPLDHLISEVEGWREQHSYEAAQYADDVEQQLDDHCDDARATHLQYLLDYCHRQI